MEDSRYLQWVSQIHAGGQFQEHTARRMLQALTAPGEEAPQKKHVSSRRWIALAASLLVLAGVCVAGVTSGLFLRMPGKGTPMPSTSESIAEIAPLPTLEFQGKRYQVDEWNPDSISVSSSLLGEKAGTGRYQEKDVDVYEVDGYPPQIALAASLDGEEYRLFAFSGFINEPHSAMEIISLYEEACGPVQSIACVRKDYTSPQETGETLASTSSLEEVSGLLPYFEEMRPDSSIRLGDRNTQLSPDGSTYTHTIETDGRELLLRFSDGTELTFSLYLQDLAAGGFGHLYTLPQGLSAWAKS